MKWLEFISMNVKYYWTFIFLQILGIFRAIYSKDLKEKFNPWVRKIPWRKKWQLTPLSLPRKPHGQRSMAGYSPWGCRVRDDWATNTLVSLSRLKTPMINILYKNSISQTKQSFLILDNIMENSPLHIPNLRILWITSFRKYTINRVKTQWIPQ